MKSKELENIEKIIDRVYAHWKDIRRETIISLGKELSSHIIDFHGNNWIEITRWIHSEYSREEQYNIVNFQFNTLFKEIYWLQFLFYVANYAMIYRNLRYDLEMMTQAHYIDNKYSNFNLDAQFVKLAEEEKTMFGWRFVRKELASIFEMDSKTIDEFFHPIWEYLNKHVHPSGVQMDIIAEKNIESLVKDSFNRELAIKALKVTDTIFEVIYLIIFKKYPKIRKEAINYKHLSEWEEHLPKLVFYIKGDKNSGDFQG